MSTIEDLEWQLLAKRFQLSNAINKNDRETLKAEIAELAMVIQTRKEIRESV